MRFIKRLCGLFLQIGGGAHIVGDDENGALSRRNIFLSSLVYNIVLGVLNGTYLSSFCLSIGANANGVNIAVIIMSFSNLVQIIAPLVMERLHRKKKTLLILRAAAHGVNLLIIPFLALLGINEKLLFPLVVALLGLAQCTFAFISPGVQTWHIANIPNDKRLGYFSFFTVINCITTNAALFLSGLAVDRLINAFGTRSAISGLRFFLVLLAIADLLFLSRVSEHPVEKESFTGLKSFFSQMLSCVKECPSYVKIVAVASIWNLVANIPSQYYNTYLIQNLKLSYTLLNSVTLFNVVAVTIFTPLWKRVIRSKGVRGCLFISVLFYAPHAIGLALVGEGTVFLYPVSVFYNLIFAAGINLCFSMVPYIGLPERHRGMYMAFYNTCCALCALIGILVGRVIFTVLLSCSPIIVNGVHIEPARILVVIFSLAMVAAAFLFFHLLKGCSEQD